MHLSYKSYNKLQILAIIFILLLVFISGCIELKPRESPTTTINVSITQGSDTCIGWNESTCGAFLKEKRTEFSDFTCEGPVGPSERLISDFKYNLNPEAGWTCKEEKGEISLSYSGNVGDHNYIGRNSKFESKKAIEFSIFMKSLNKLTATCVLDDWGATIGFGYLTAVVLFGDKSWTPFAGWYVGRDRCDQGWMGYGRSDSSLMEANPSVFGGKTISSKVAINITVSGTTPEKCKECHKSDFKTKCSWRPWTDVVSNNYLLSCTLNPIYSTTWICSNEYTQQQYRFTNCSHSKYSSFQGGRAYLDNDTPYSEIANYLQSFYGSFSYNPITGETEPVGTTQVPFFMLGQGPSFKDYEEARKLCTPYKEQIVNISLGNTTFDPPILVVPKMEICIINDDKVNHDIDLFDLRTNEVVKQFTLSSKETICFKPDEGYYQLRDSNKDYAELSIFSTSSTSDTSNIYIGSRIVPNYSLITEGGMVSFSLIQRIERNLSIKAVESKINKYEQNFTLNLTNPSFTLNLREDPNNIIPSVGEYIIKDNTGQTGYLFIQSQTNKFIFKFNGTTFPATEIYRPLGDTICFTSETEGITLNISRFSQSDSEEDWIQIYSNEPVPKQPAYCCIEGVLPGKYYAVSNDGRVVKWTIGNGKPSASINIQSIGFEPEALDSPPGTKICWINPSAVTREISTIFSRTQKTFFSAKIPPLSNDVCYPVMKEVGSYLTRFISPAISISQVTNIKELGSKEIKVLSGGFDSKSIAIQPGQQVCWTNTDTKNHTLTRENGLSIMLQPMQSDCIPRNQTIDGSLFYRKLDGKEIYSYVAVIDGSGVFLTSKGPVPSTLFVQTTGTNISSDGTRQITRPEKFRIFNKQNVSSKLYEIKAVQLSSNSTGTAYEINNTLFVNNITSYTAVKLLVENNDNKDHNISVIVGGIEKAKVRVPAGQPFIFELNDNTVLVDETIRQSLISAGVKNSTKLDAYSQIRLNIIGPKEIILSPARKDGSIVELIAPTDPMTSILTENNTDFQMFLSFSDLSGYTLTNPLNNITLDLPVQVVRGDLSSDILSDMRKYADSGAISMIIPSFRNITVTISSSVFSPQNSSIPAGSTITITNKDNILHTISIIKKRDGQTSTNVTTLGILASYSTANTEKNTTFNLRDHESNLNGTVNIVAYDATIGISSKPISPQVGMVVVGGPVKFNNYDSNSGFNIDITLITATGEKRNYSLSAPKYSSELPGQVVWIPDVAGNATYIVKNSSNIIGSGTIVVKNSTINISVRNGTFEYKSLAIDHNSKVCFIPDSTRTISITNIDTNQKITSVKIVPFETNVSGEGVCNKIYSCATKSNAASNFRCGGMINESDASSYCYYNIINSSLACQVNTTSSCEVKSEYSSDLECTSDYSKDVDINKPGIQPQCWFKASSTGDACKGKSVLKNESFNSIISCSISNDGKLQFSFLSGKDRTNVSNALCTVSFSGGVTKCTPTKLYSDIGCVNGSAGDTNCYYTPSSLNSSEISNPYTISTNRFCNVGTSQRTEIYYEPYPCDIGWDGTCTCQTSKMCGDLPCRGESVLAALNYYTSSGCGSNAGYAYNCSNNKIVLVCAKTGQLNLNFPGIGTFSKYMKPGSSFKVCKCYSKKSKVVTYASSCSVKTGGSTVSPYPTSCTVENDRCKFSSPSQFICSNSINCPCSIGCGKKINYSNLGNINCSIVQNECKVISNYNRDDGKYCQHAIRNTCVPKDGYIDKVSCGFNGTACLISKSNNIRDDGTRCETRLTSCETKYSGINCTFDSASNTCKASGNEVYCFTPGSTYLVEDVESGDTLTIKGYDRYTPLEIDIQKSEMIPPIATTSPLSDMCFVSLDGKQHTLTMPGQINNGNDLIVNGTAKCLQFPYNPEPWIVRLKDNPNIGAEISSIKKDIEIIVKSQMFNPSDIILRPGTSLTFINNDNAKRVLLKSSTTLQTGNIYTNSTIPLTFSGLFNLNNQRSWIDPVICKNNSDCPSGSFCDIEGKCRPLKQCLKDGDCPSRSVCHNGACVVPRNCTASIHCDSGELCLNNKCVSVSYKCTTNNECPINSICVQNINGSGDCVSIRNCTSSSDCQGGSICYNNFCTVNQNCATNADCPVNFACINNVCMEPYTSLCNTSENCQHNFSCEIPWGFEEEGIKTCHGIVCANNSDCLTAYGQNSNVTCINFDIESSSGKCTSYEVNKSFQFEDETFCTHSTFVDGKCIMPKKCSSDLECPIIGGVKLICSDNNCKIPLQCSTNTDCPSNNICNNGICKSLYSISCVNDTDCPQGNICSNFNCISRQKCSSTDNCSKLYPSSACTNESSSTAAFCKLTWNCTTDASCPPFNRCINNLCTSYPKTTCDYPFYGINNSQFNLSFNLPLSTFKVYMVYSFNDNGIISLNGQTVVSPTKNICEHITSSGIKISDKWTASDTVKIPMGLVKVGSETNNILITICSCSGEKGLNVTLYYQYVDPLGIMQEGKVEIDPNSQKTIYMPATAQEFAYLEEKTLTALPVAVKPCSGSDLSSMAVSIGSYERLDYKTLECDAGKLDVCKSYNPYGPATVAFVSTEAELNLSNSSELNCALDQIAAIKTYCKNCTSVLNVGQVNLTQLASILKIANESGKLEKVDVIGHDVFINNYKSCDFEEIMNSIVNKSKLGLYNYTKPSIITRFGLKEGGSVNSACNWTGESIVTTYQDFYGIWIPILAGSGVLGTAQYCLTDPCPAFDFYGLLTQGKTNKPYTEAWFREGCGRYYYNAEGLSFTTFSMKETNYSLCDPARMLALLQTAQCAIGKYTLKSGIS